MEPNFIMADLNKLLDIFIITYNREAQLASTLKQLCAANSPLNKAEITVLDNNSTDNTAKVIKEYSKINKNIKYIKNRYNNGLAGNLIKAMELASKDYFWILCDDDDYSWESWPEIQKAMADGYDIVMTTYTKGFRSEEIPFLINEMGFVPSAIYKTAHINDTVIRNAYMMAYNLFPFHALSCKIINENGRIFVPKNRTVLQSYEEKSHQVKKENKNLFYRINSFSLMWGYIDSYRMIKDKKLREQCFDVLALGKGFFGSMIDFIDWPPFKMQNFCDIFLAVSFKKKILLLSSALVYLLSKNPIIWFYRTDSGINIRLFYFIKTKIIPFKKKKQL